MLMHFLFLFNKNFDEVESNIERNLKKISKIPKIKDRISFIKDNIPVFLKVFKLSYIIRFQLIFNINNFIFKN